MLNLCLWNLVVNWVWKNCLWIFFKYLYWTYLADLGIDSILVMKRGREREWVRQRWRRQRKEIRINLFVLFIRWIISMQKFPLKFCLSNNLALKNDNIIIIIINNNNNRILWTTLRLTMAVFSRHIIHSYKASSTYVPKRDRLLFCSTIPLIGWDRLMWRTDVVTVVKLEEYQPHYYHVRVRTIGQSGNWRISKKTFALKVDAMIVVDWHHLIFGTCLISFPFMEIICWKKVVHVCKMWCLLTYTTDWVTSTDILPRKFMLWRHS